FRVGFFLLTLLLVVFFLLFFLLLILFLIACLALGILRAQFFGGPGGGEGREFARNERGNAKRRRCLTHGLVLCDHGKSKKRDLATLGLFPIRRAYQNPEFFHLSTANSSGRRAGSGGIETTLARAVKGASPLICNRFSIVDFGAA